jgi:hypothetical protein
MPFERRSMDSLFVMIQLFLMLLLYDYHLSFGHWGGPLVGKRTITKVKANRKELELIMLRDDGVQASNRFMNKMEVSAIFRIIQKKPINLSS